jgi:hypothetical protein
MYPRNTVYFDSREAGLGLCWMHPRAHLSDYYVHNVSGSTCGWRCVPVFFWGLAFGLAFHHSITIVSLFHKLLTLSPPHVIIVRSLFLFLSLSERVGLQRLGDFTLNLQYHQNEH